MSGAKRVVVTGGCGFIGSELVRHLAREGCDVLVVDNLSFGSWDNLPEAANVEFAHVDIRNPEELEGALGRFRPASVFHLAALHYIPYCIAHPHETMAVNVEGTYNVAEACAKSGVGRLVYASTAAVYKISDVPHRESDGIVAVEVYGLSKILGEVILEQLHAKSGITCAAARLFNAFGLRETNPHVIPEIIAQLRQGDEVRLGNIEPKRDFIHTSDVARAMLALDAAPDIGFDVFNVGSGRQLSVREIVDLLAARLGREIRIVQDPARVRKVERQYLGADISKIGNRLGWRPETTLEKGFEEIIEKELLGAAAGAGRAWGGRL